MSTKTNRNSQKNAKKTLKEQILDEYEGIIGKHETNDNKFVCIVCQGQNSPFYTGFWHNCKDHINSKTHKKVIQKLTSEVSDSDPSKEQEDSIIENLANEIERNAELPKVLSLDLKGELDMAYTKFLLQYRLPFSIAGPLNTFFQQIASNYSNDVIQTYTVNRNTITHAASTICETLKNNIFQELRATPFSLSLDASSDSNGNSFLAVCIRLIEKGFDRPTTKLISILPITTSSTGQTIFDMLTNTVLINEEIKQNCMGIVTDEGSNMTGIEKGVSSRLKEVCNHVVDMKDICHLLNNIFKKALEAIPKEIIDIIKNICSHFHRSTQKNALLRQILIEKNIKPLEILYQSKTRWLSMRDCIGRILELWPALQSYFLLYGSDTQKEYFAPENELFLRILSLLLHNIIDCNEYFQKDDLFYNEVLEKLKHTYVIIANLIIKKTEKTMDFTKVFEIPFEKNNIQEIKIGKVDPDVQKILITPEEFEKVYLMRYDSVKDILNKVSEEKKSEICTASIKFINICLKEMKINLPYTNEIMNLTQIIFFEEDYDENKWLNLKDLFPNIIKSKKQKDDFTAEVHRMEYTFAKIREKLRNSIGRVSPLTLWKNEAQTYPNMNLLVEALLVLPYSSVPVERVFSSLKDIKTPKRNRLTVFNLEACLLGYQAFKSQSFNITEEMVQNYVHKKKLLIQR